MIAAKVRQIDRNHVQRINQISETNNHDITSPLEGMTLRNDNIQGGSGFAAATVADLGFEPTDGATHTATGGGRRARAKAKSGAGISSGALLADKDANAILRPQPPPGMEARITLQASPHKDQLIPQASKSHACRSLGGSRKKWRWNIRRGHIKWRRKRWRRLRWKEVLSPK